MACGKPVIAVDYKALKETIEREHCGLIVPANRGVAEVVKAIEHYLLHPEEMLRHGRNGRQAVEERYNWSVGEKSSSAFTPGFWAVQSGVLSLWPRKNGTRSLTELLSARARIQRRK